MRFQIRLYITKYICYLRNQIIPQLQKYMLAFSFKICLIFWNGGGDWITQFKNRKLPKAINRRVITANLVPSTYLYLWIIFFQVCFTFSLTIQVSEDHNIEIAIFDGEFKKLCPSINQQKLDLSVLDWVCGTDAFSVCS